LRVRLVSREETKGPDLQPKPCGAHGCSKTGYFKSRGKRARPALQRLTMYSSIQSSCVAASSSKSKALDAL